MILLYDDGCPVCRLLSWLASLRSGLERVPLDGEEVDDLLEELEG